MAATTLMVSPPRSSVSTPRLAADVLAVDVDVDERAQLARARRRAGRATGSARSAAPTVGASSSNDFRPPAWSASRPGSRTVTTPRLRPRAPPAGAAPPRSTRPRRSERRRPSRSSCRSRCRPGRADRTPCPRAAPRPRRVPAARSRRAPSSGRRPGAVDAEAAVRRHPVAAADLALRAARRVLRDHERRVRVAVVERDRKAEAARQAVVLEPLPVLAPVVGAVDAAVVLLPQAPGLPWMEQQLVDALADLRERVVGHEVRCRPLVRRRPGPAAVLAAEDARGRDADVHRLRIVRVDLDRVRAHPAGAGIPALASRMLDQAQHGIPALAAVVRAEEDAGRAAEPQRPVGARARRATSSRASARDPRVGRGPRSAPTSCRGRRSVGRSRRRRQWFAATKSDPSSLTAWKTSQPRSNGPSTSHERRSSSP